jgi:hypothetical protein
MMTMKTNLSVFLILSAAALLPSVAMANNPATEPQVVAADPVGDGSEIAFKIVLPGFHQCGAIVSRADIKPAHDGNYGEIHFNYDPTKGDPRIACPNPKSPPRDSIGYLNIPVADLKNGPYHLFWGTQAVPASQLTRFSGRPAGAPPVNPGFQPAARGVAPQPAFGQRPPQAGNRFPAPGFQPTQPMAGPAVAPPTFTPPASQARPLAGMSFSLTDGLVHGEIALPDDGSGDAAQAQ